MYIWRKYFKIATLIFLNICKQSILVVLSLVFLISTAQFNVFANEEKNREKVKVGKTEVVVYDDGRVKAVKNPEKLTKKVRKKILKKMRFTEEINNLSENLQNEILIDDGVKVDVYIKDMQETEYFVSYEYKWKWNDKKYFAHLEKIELLDDN
ncbi:hypothetical protein [Chengkuizengella marina]|uniref:Uncharacterized protein n=1 Tax=Chengkuizengella marina TaxID=2507566 RepID=A0A6N9Q1Y2_9BACL|nr:hypothetical protein [Chengkuizengella marina]NBI28254.1 hypothetical protein [Chengkuizengella marina]